MIKKSEMNIRNQRMIDAAFELFAEHNIEFTTMQAIADKAEVGIASLFRYYPSKLDLACAVCAAKWKEYFENSKVDEAMKEIDSNTTIENVNYILDVYVDLYKNHKKLLLFNDNFNHFFDNRSEESSTIQNYWDVLNPISKNIHLVYKKGVAENVFRTDLTESELTRLMLHTMMGACHHYVGGFIWEAADDAVKDYTSDIIHVKNMIISYILK